jgi:hypothetical protein
MLSPSLARRASRDCLQALSWQQPFDRCQFIPSMTAVQGAAALKNLGIVGLGLMGHGIA